MAFVLSSKTELLDAELIWTWNLNYTLRSRDFRSDCSSVLQLHHTCYIPLPSMELSLIVILSTIICLRLSFSSLVHLCVLWLIYQSLLYEGTHGYYYLLISLLFSLKWKLYKGRKWYLNIFLTSYFWFKHWARTKGKIRV